MGGALPYTSDAAGAQIISYSAEKRRRLCTCFFSAAMHCIHFWFLVFPLVFSFDHREKTTGEIIQFNDAVPRGPPAAAEKHGKN